MVQLLSVILTVLQFISLSSAQPTTLKRDGGSTTTITSAVFDTISLYEQFAAAAYCPLNLDATLNNKKLACASNNCPLVQSANTSIVLQRREFGSIALNAYVAIDYTHSLIVFAIRGTNTSSTRSLGSDLLSLLPVPLPQLCTGCSGSAPWLAGWTDVKAAVTQAIQDALKKNPTFKVLITGHSLGGAVASLAAFDLRKAGSSLSLVTFGAPRFGNSVLARLVNAQDGVNNNINYRVSHINDAVPNAPATVGYEQIQPNYFINTGNTQVPTAANVVVNRNATNYIAVGPLDITTVGGAHTFYINAITACGSAPMQPAAIQFAADYRDMIANGTIPKQA